MVLTDNFGLFLAGHFGKINNNGSKVVAGFLDDTGVSRSLQIYGQRGSDKNYNDVGGSQMQVGKGLTPVSRQDFNIENVFASSPEKDKVTTALAGFNSGLGKISFASTIPNVTDNDSVTEVCHFRTMQTNAPATKVFLMIHDLVSPVSFITGETINTEHNLLV